MSFLATGYASPSRIKGAYAYLLQQPTQSVKTEELLKLVSPEALVRDESGKRAMAVSVVREAVNAGLFVQEDDCVKLHSELPPVLSDPTLGIRSLPWALTDLCFGPHPDNHDLALWVAWFLAQDLYDGPASEEEFLTRYNEQMGDDGQARNDVRYGQFEDWLCFLGFGWRFGGARSRLMADPTAFLRQRLAHLFADAKGAELSIRTFIQNLGSLCPVFETGSFRNKVEERISPRPSDYLSETTAFALLRLESEGLIQLRALSDSPETTLLPTGSKTRSVSHIALKGKG